MSRERDDGLSIGAVDACGPASEIKQFLPSNERKKVTVMNYFAYFYAPRSLALLQVIAGASASRGFQTPCDLEAGGAAISRFVPSCSLNRAPTDDTR